MEKVKKKMQDLRNEVEEKEDRISELCKLLDEERVAKQELEDEKRSLEYKVKTLSDDLEVTEGKLTDAESAKNTLETSYTDTTAYTKSQIDTLERDLDRATVERDDFKSRCTEAEEGREIAEREVTALNARVEALEAALEKEECKSKQIQAELDATMEELNTI